MDTAIGMHSFSVKINSPYDWLVNDLKKIARMDETYCDKCPRYDG